MWYGVWFGVNFVLFRNPVIIASFIEDFPFSINCFGTFDKISNTHVSVGLLKKNSILTPLHDLWDLSSPTWAPGSESTEP